MTPVPRLFSTSALVALVLTTVWLFLPSGLGGGTTYVTTHGASMEPRFHTGDLALLSPASAYSVGDVVAYRSDTLDSIVMHRIVSGDAGGFVTKGDNNDWLDPDEPSQDELMGELFLRIPQGGKVVDALSAPGFFVAIAAAALTAVGSAGASRRTRRVREAARRPGTRAFSTSTRARARQVALGAAGVVLLAAVACCALLVLPPTSTQTRTVEVAQRGEFSYTGRAEPGTTYPTGAVTTGDTIWTRLATDLTVSFTDTMTGPGLAGVTGDLRLEVLVTAADGWSAVLDSGPPVGFQDGTATAAVGIDPEAAAALVARHYTEIGTPGSSATLTVTPVAATTGTVEGRSFQAVAPEGLAFTIEAAALRPAGDLATALTPSAETRVTIEEAVPRSFGVLALSVPFDVAQRGAGGLLLAGLVALAVGAWIGRSQRGDVADQFVLRHADRILPVTAFTPGPAVVDVSDPEALHRVAERFDTVVLHHTGPDGDTFAVRDLEMTYRFVVPGVAGRPGGTPPVPPPTRARTPAAAPRADPVAPAAPPGLWGRAA